MALGTAARSTRSSAGEMLVWLGLAVCLLSFNAGVVRSQDPDEVLDFCVAVLGTSTQNTGVWQTGTEDSSWTAPSDPSQMGVAAPLNDTTDSIFPCKDVNTVTVNDFIFQGLAQVQKVTNELGALVTLAGVTQFPALNTLGISTARIDFLKNGLNPPHLHPRATEVLYVLSGSLLVGFVDTNNDLFQQTLQTGDVFVFPQGLLHFEMEVGWGPASAFSGFNSQNPGKETIVTDLLGANPPISAVVIETALNIDQKAFQGLEWSFSTTLH
jgi:quercetin dioxygenase-like cupin family protein